MFDDEVDIYTDMQQKIFLIEHYISFCDIIDIMSINFGSILLESDPKPSQSMSNKNFP